MQAAQSRCDAYETPALGISERSNLPLPDRMEDELWNEIDRIFETADKIVGHQKDLQEYTSLDQDVLYPCRRVIWTSEADTAVFESIVLCCQPYAQLNKAMLGQL